MTASLYMRFAVFVCLLPAWAALQAQPSLPEVEPYFGMSITRSCRIKPGEYLLIDPNGTDSPAIDISGKNITVDFSGVTLRGAKPSQAPDTYSGVALFVSGSSVTIKNLKAHGFATALMAVGVDSLTLLDCDLSYNYRKRLHSMREREDLSDWLSYHQNENDEWAVLHRPAVYLKNCNFALVRGLRVTGCQNGLLLSGCNNGLFYNNTIHFNSGLGIGLYRSSRNRILYNRLDWNVRGYSHGFYSRGQDSAGILCYEQSNENVFAFNSATHSGDGFFLWAGQHTMDTGEGGCNNNLLYDNDFSHSPTNGIEVTFSSNVIIGNRLEDCTYGIWGGYSWNTFIAHNYIARNTWGIAIEHGQDNAIEYNLFRQNGVGIRLWQRDVQPADWPYAQKRDVRSRGYSIRGNAFDGDSIPLRIAASHKVAINDFNVFAGFKQLLVADQPNTDFHFVKNTVHQPGNWGAAAEFRSLNHATAKPAPQEKSRWDELARAGAGHDMLSKWPNLHLPDGMNAMLPASHPRGRHEMRITEWGPYDYRRPIAWLENIRDSVYTFVLLGPPGQWTLQNARGLAPLGRTSGALPDTIRMRRLPREEDLLLELEYLGAEVVMEWGQRIPAGQRVPFQFRRFEKPLSWRVRFYHYSGDALPASDYGQWSAQRPVKDTTLAELAGRWWGSPAPGVQADRFITLAETELQATPGDYELILTSDDGVRLWLDDALIWDAWNVHEPRADTIKVKLSGRHRLRIAHFDAGGLATLDFRMRRE